MKVGGTGLMTRLVIDTIPELGKRLEEEAERHGLPLSDFVRPALEALVTPDAEGKATLAGLAPDKGADSPPIGETLLAMVEEVWGEVPEEELARLPADLAT